MKQYGKKYIRLPWVQCVLMAFGINLIIEVLARHSLLAALGHIVGEPLAFLYNMGLIFLTLSVSTLFLRRYFVMLCITAVWLILGIINGVLLSFRVSPFSASDLLMLKSSFHIVTIYLNLFQMILIVAGFLGLAALLVLAWRKLPKSPRKLLPAVLQLGAAALLTFGGFPLLLHLQVLSKTFPNLADAYQSYGFAYCFSMSLVDTGIDEPETYSETTVADVLNELTQIPDNQPNLAPNILFLQLESFYDMTHVEGLTFSADPIPFFRSLKETYSSGRMTVPSVGAGTANTEFEILTGLSMSYFGPGEYPYKTVAKRETCETLAYNLKQYGYAGHAIHNNDGTFYDRHLVFSNFGFDTFTSLEYMYNVTYNPLGWAKDEVLTEEILKCLDATTARDFIYTVSVQGHGRYPSVPVDETQTITVEGAIDEEQKTKLEYFANQLAEMDLFLRELIDALSRYGEPMVLVLYGDHLPSLGLLEEQLLEGTLFDVEYIIWDNIGLVKRDTDVHSYQLSAYLQERLGMNAGTITKFHQSFHERDSYLSKLELLEYDTLYGERLLYQGENPYVASELQMGIEPILISELIYTGTASEPERRQAQEAERVLSETAEEPEERPETATPTPTRGSGGSFFDFGDDADETLYVFGKNFNEWSYVCVNGRLLETEYIAPSLLIVREAELEPNDIVTVAQAGKDRDILSETEGVAVAAGIPNGIKTSGRIAERSRN